MTEIKILHIASFVKPKYYIYAHNISCENNYLHPLYPAFSSLILPYNSLYSIIIYTTVLWKLRFRIKSKIRIRVKSKLLQEHKTHFISFNVLTCPGNFRKGLLIC